MLSSKGKGEGHSTVNDTTYAYSVNLSPKGEGVKYLKIMSI